MNRKRLPKALENVDIIDYWIRVLVFFLALICFLLFGLLVWGLIAWFLYNYISFLITVGSVLFFFGFPFISFFLRPKRDSDRWLRPRSRW